VREAICDTSPIQYLHQIGFLYLLTEFYSRTIIPPAVMDELERGRSIGVDLPDVCALPWLTIQAPERLDRAPTMAHLGAGEKEVLALGTQVPDAVVILDERLGRLHAELLKLTFTGTLGILLRAKAEGRILRIEPLLEHLDRLGFRLSARTRAAVLNQAGERSLGQR
jgi:predicted nucleic acid-binding protein